jgi:hypothetical protein
MKYCIFLSQMINYGLSSQNKHSGVMWINQIHHEIIRIIFHMILMIKNHFKYA